MEDNMSFAEGTYRIGSGDWKVFIISKRDVAQTVWKHGSWDSGVSGIAFEVPLATTLNMPSVERLLAEVHGVAEWRRVKGPDSMVLR
jgi:hypothetical protein